MHDIDSFSFVPLHLETFFEKQKLKDATCFIITSKGSFFLITNWHVLSGRNPETLQPSDTVTGAIPDRIKVWFHGRERDVIWLQHELPLLDCESKLWFEHPSGSSVDVAGLKLPDQLSGVIHKPLTLSLNDDRLVVHPAENVSIVGFPFGKPSYGQFPVWKTGHVASDVGLDYDEKPIFLIDATVRSGMSGSPVIARKFNHPMITDASQSLSSRYIDQFLGVFSGGLSNTYDTEIGLVWKPRTINELLANIE